MALPHGLPALLSLILSSLVAACLFKSQPGTSSVTPSPTPPTMGYPCKHSCILCLFCLPQLVQEAWLQGVEQTTSKLLCRCCSKRSCLPVKSWVKVTPISLATLLMICKITAFAYRYEVSLLLVCQITLSGPSLGLPSPSHTCGGASQPTPLTQL